MPVLFLSKAVPQVSENPRAVAVENTSSVGKLLKKILAMSGRSEKEKCKDGLGAISHLLPFHVAIVDLGLCARGLHPSKMWICLETLLWMRSEKDSLYRQLL